MPKSADMSHGRQQLLQVTHGDGIISHAIQKSMKLCDASEGSGGIGSERLPQTMALAW